MLVVCSACSRHVRKDESACPFCKAPLVAADLPPTRLDSRRLHGLAMALGAAAAASACGKTTTKKEEIPVIAAPYGVPITPDAAPTPTGPSTIAAVYGAPPVQAIDRPDAAPTGDAADAGAKASPNTKKKR